MIIDNGLNFVKDLSIQLQCGDNLFVYDILSQLAGFAYYFQYKYKKSNFKQVSISFQADTIKNYKIKQCESVEMLLLETYSILSLFNKPFKIQRNNGEQKFSKVSLCFDFYESEIKIINSFKKARKNKERFSFFIDKLKEILNVQLIEANNKEQKIEEEKKKQSKEENIRIMELVNERGITLKESIHQNKLFIREQRLKLKAEKEQLRLAVLRDKINKRKEEKEKKEHLRLAALRDKIKTTEEKIEKKQQEPLKIKAEIDKKNLETCVHKLNVHTVKEPLTKRNIVAEESIAQNEYKVILREKINTTNEKIDKNKQERLKLKAERNKKKLDICIYGLKVNNEQEPLTKMKIIAEESITQNEDKGIIDLMNMNIVYVGDINIINDLKGFFK